jgi:hypothetical protein
MQTDSKVYLKLLKPKVLEGDTQTDGQTETDSQTEL